MKQFSDILSELHNSDAYKEFIKEHPSYYLAHGFIQFGSDFKTSKDWQIGFYSKDKDNLALFHTNPIKFVGFEDAFKEGGLIDELKFSESFIDVDKLESIISSFLASEYDQEKITSFICIVQSLNGKELYNVTAITSSFSMISLKIDALSGKIILHKKSSILDLKKDDNEESKKSAGEEE